MTLDGIDAKRPVQRVIYSHSIDAKRGEHEANEPSDQRLCLFLATRNRPGTGTQLELGTEFHFSTRYRRINASYRGVNP